MDTPTKTQILDTAERLFAELGFDATSLRALTAAAQVNLAAVNYHFGSKEGLICAVFERRLDPINIERIAELEAAIAEAAAAGREPTLEAVLTAFFGPVLRMARDPGGANFMRLLGRMHADPDAHALREQIYAQFRDLRDRFMPHIAARAPHLSAEELFWRVHFTIGVMAHTLTCSVGLDWLSNGVCTTMDAEPTMARMVAFCAAGLRAPLDVEVRR